MMLLSKYDNNSSGMMLLSKSSGNPPGMILLQKKVGGGGYGRTFRAKPVPAANVSPRKGYQQDSFFAARKDIRSFAALIET